MFKAGAYLHHYERFGVLEPAACACPALTLLCPALPATYPPLSCPACPPIPCRPSYPLPDLLSPALPALLSPALPARPSSRLWNHASVSVLQLGADRRALPHLHRTSSKGALREDLRATQNNTMRPKRRHTRRHRRRQYLAQVGKRPALAPKCGRRLDSLPGLTWHGVIVHLHKRMAPRWREYGNDGRGLMDERIMQSSH